MRIDYNELNNELQDLSNQTDIHTSDTVKTLTNESKEQEQLRDQELEQRWLDEQSYCIHAEHDLRYQLGA